MRHPYAFGVDFWAAAVTLFKMLTGRVCLGLSFITSSNSSRCQVPWYADSAIDVKSIVLYEKLEIDDDEMDHVTKDFMRKVSSYLFLPCYCNSSPCDIRCSKSYHPNVYVAAPTCIPIPISKTCQCFSFSPCFLFTHPVLHPAIGFLSPGKLSLSRLSGFPHHNLHRVMLTSLYLSSLGNPTMTAPTRTHTLNSIGLRREVGMLK